MEARLFLSYSSADAKLPELDGLLQDIADTGNPFWYDHQLTGGFEWWEQILDEIRSSDIVVYALSSRSVGSVACERELAWARATDRRILPVAIDKVSDVDRPPWIKPNESIDYSEKFATPRRSSQCALKLARAIHSLEELGPRPVPPVLPRPPDMPPGRLDALQEFVAAAELSQSQQERLVSVARSLVETGHGDRFELKEDLERLNCRRCINVGTHSELDALIERLEHRELPTGAATDDVGADTGRVKIHRIRAPGVDIWSLGEQLKQWFEAQKMLVSMGDRVNGEVWVHCRGKPRARLTGAGAEQLTELSIKGDTLTITISGGKWSDKAISFGGAIALGMATSGLGLLLATPSVVGTYRQAVLAGKTIDYIEKVVSLCVR